MVNTLVNTRFKIALARIHDVQTRGKIDHHSPPFPFSERMIRIKFKGFFFIVVMDAVIIKLYINFHGEIVTFYSSFNEGVNNAGKYREAQVLCVCVCVVSNAEDQQSL